MKKQCNRILAMLLAVLTLLSVLPISSLAASWLDVEQETTTDENVTTNNITITLDAKALLSYLKNRDVEGLVSGLSVNGLRDILSAETLFEIIPEEKFTAIIEAVEKDLTPEVLLQYIDVEELLKTVDKSQLIDLVAEIDDLQNYIKDYGPIADEITAVDIDAAIDYIDVDALVKAYAKELLHLALDDLTNDELLAIVDVEAAVELQDIDIYEALDKDALRDTVTYDRLFDEFVYDEALKAFVTKHFESWNSEYLEHFVHIEELEALMLDAAHVGTVSEFIHVDALQAHLATVTFDYETLKEKSVINESKLIDILESATYDDVSSYLTTDETLLQSTFETMSGKDMDDDFDTFWNAYLIDDGNGGHTLDTPKFFEEQPELVDYSLLISSGVLNVNAMLTDGDGAYNLKALNEKDVIDLPNLLRSHIPGFTISDLENAGVISYEEIIFGKPGVNGGEALFTYGELVDHELLDFGLLIEGDGDIPPFFTINELYLDGVINADALYEEFGADTLVDLDNLKTQLLSLLDAQKLTADDVIGCIVKDSNGNIDYAAVIDTLHGVEYIVDNTGLTYEAILTNYVTDFKGLMNALGLETILQNLINAGKIDQAFDIAGLIGAIGFKKLLQIVDVKSLLTQLYNDGSLQALLAEIDPDTFIACLNIFLNALHNNVREIKINDVVITRYDAESRLISFNVERLMQAIQVTFPTLEELAELEGDVLLDGIGLSVTYVPEGGTETKTYAINATVKLVDGVDRVRETAIEIKNLVDRYLTYSYENNDIVFELRLPDQFATALKETLNSLGAETDPELLALRDELLALYDANLTDTANFLQKLTLKQIVALLEKVDTTALTDTYNKLMKQRYVEVVLEYIEGATGIELVDVEIGTLMETLADITVPTVEQVAEKVESLTGRDLLSRLPSRVEGAWESAQKRQIAEILDSIAAKVGMDSDIKQILQEANATDDPLQYVYDTFVNLLENSENAYVEIRERVLDVYDRVINSKVGEHFDTYHLDALYTGDGKFLLEESLEINPKTYITRAVDKTIELLLQGRQLDEDLIKNIKELALGMIDDEAFTFNVSGTLKVDDLYRAVFYDYDATSPTGLALLGEFFLPVGTDLNLLMEYNTGDPTILFEGWADSGVVYAAMPEQDVVLFPKTNDTSCTITVYAPDQIGQTPAWGGQGTIGEKIADDVVTLLQEKPVTTWDNDTVTWYVVENGVKTNLIWDFEEDVLEGDLVLTWEITHAAYTVQVVDPDSKKPVTNGSFIVTRGETLSDEQIAAMDALVPAYPYGYVWHSVDQDGQIDSAEFDFDAEIHSAVKVTWVYNPEPLPEYEITVVDSDGDAVGEPIIVEHGTTLESIKEQLLAKTDSAAKGLVPAWYTVVDDGTGGTTETYITLDETAIVKHYTLTWKYYAITVYDQSDLTKLPITFELGDDNTGITTALLTEKAGLDAANEPAWYELAYPAAPTKDTAVFTGSTEKVTGDRTFAWKYFTLTYYDLRDPSVTHKIENIGVGKKLADYQAALNTGAGATAGKTPAWYVRHVDELGAEEWLAMSGTTSITWDLTLGWRYHLVTIHDPSNYNTVIDSFEMGVDQALTRDMLETAAGTPSGKHPGWYRVDADGYTQADKFTAFDQAITADLDLTWQFHHVNVWDDAGNKLGYVEVGDCDSDGNAVKLESLKAEILANETLITLIPGKTPVWYVASATGAFDAQSDVVDWTVAIDGNYNIAWKYYTVAVHSPVNGALLDTFTLGEGEKVNSILNDLNTLAGAVGSKVPAWYVLDADLAFTKDDKFTAFATALDWDLSLTWKYYTVTVHSPETGAVAQTFTLGDGEKVNSILNDLNTLAGFDGSKAPAWYALDADLTFTKDDKFTAFATALDWDLSLTWKYYTVKVYDYNTDQLITSVALGDGQTFNSAYNSTLTYLDHLQDAVKLPDHPGKVPAWYLYTSGNRGALYQNALGNALDWDVDLTYHYPVISVEIWGSTGAENSEHIQYPNLTGNSYLVSYDSTYAALIAQIADKYAGYEEWLLEAEGHEWMGAVYSSFHNEWKQNADGTIDLDQTARIADDATIYLYILPDTTKPGFSIGGSDNHEAFAITFEDGTLYVTLGEEKWKDSEIFTLDFDNLGAVISDAHGYGITFTNAGGAQSIHMSHEMLEVLHGAMQTAGASTVTLKYAEVEVYSEGDFAGADWVPNAGSGAISYSYEFEFDGVPVDGSFFGKAPDGKDVVELTLTFPKAQGNLNFTGDVQTFLYVNGMESNDWITAIHNGSVTVAAEHFSHFTLVNKYNLTYHENAFVWDSSLAGFNLLPFNQIGNIFTGDPFVSGYYAEGETITVNEGFSVSSPYVGKLSYVKTNMLGPDGTPLNSAPGTMPANPVKLQNVVSTPVYHVYYYAYNAGGNGVTPGYYLVGSLSYTSYDANKLSWETVSSYLPDGLEGGEWIGINKDAWNQCTHGSPKDVYLTYGYPHADSDDPTVVDKYKVDFRWDDEDGTTFTLENTLAGWLGEGIGSLLGADGLIAAELERLELVVPDGVIITWNITIGDETRALSDLTAEDWTDLFHASATTPIVFEASRTEREYTISTDGNVADLKPATQVCPGDTVTFTYVSKEGMVLDHIELYAGNTDISDQIVRLDDPNSFSFTMPEADVSIKVVYKKQTVSIKDQNGNEIEVSQGDRILYTVTVPSTHWIDLAQLDDAIKGFREDLDPIRVGFEKDADGNLILTYALTFNGESIDFDALRALTDAWIKEMSYRTVYVVNGTYYSTEEEALAACPEGVKIVWERGFYENMFIASFEKVEMEKEELSLDWLFILIPILLLILLIVILYKLYVRGKIGPNWFLKIITAIVSAFFAVCMGISRVMLAILRFAGHEELELVERESKRSSKRKTKKAPVLPAQTLAAPTAEPAAEAATEAATEEATEEATELDAEPAEEVPTDETEAEAEVDETDPAKTATADEAIEITVEDVTETDASETEPPQPNV